MTKDILLKKVIDNELSKSDLIESIRALPSSKFIGKPTYFKKGDIFYHPHFYHPIIILKSVKELYTCVVISSTVKEGVTFEQCRSRFFKESYFTPTLLGIPFKELKGFRMIGVYDNNKQLNEIYKQLKLKL